MHAHRDGLGSHALGDGEQAHYVAHPTRCFEVRGGHLRDAFSGDVGVEHGPAEPERREDRGLLGGVVALDVRGGIRLGEAAGDRLVQHFLVVPALVLHCREHEVGRAVHDAEHPREPLARERGSQHANDRDRARHGRLVVQVDPPLRSPRRERREVRREQCLVRGHDRGASVERGRHEREGVYAVADELDDDVGAAARDECVGVADDQRVGDPRPRLRGVGHGDPDELDRRADRVGQPRGRGRIAQRRGDRSAHRSAPE